LNLEFDILDATLFLCINEGDCLLFTNPHVLLIFQGILLVYDITNKWSFDGIDRWIKEIDEVHAKLIINICFF
jgi:hypothetical protein